MLLSFISVPIACLKSKTLPQISADNTGLRGSKGNAPVTAEHASSARKRPLKAVRRFTRFIPRFPVVQFGSTLVKTHAPEIAQAAIRAHPCEKDAGDGNFIVRCM